MSDTAKKQPAVESGAGMTWKGAIRTLYLLRERMRSAERMLRSRHPEAWTPAVCAAATLSYGCDFKLLDLCLTAIERDLRLIDDATAAAIADAAAGFAGGNVATCDR